MPSDFNPLAFTGSTSVSDVEVSLRDGALALVFADTLLPRTDTSRYKTPLQAYVLQPFVPELGKSYQLRVRSETFGTVEGTVTIPSKAYLDLAAGSLALLDRPTVYQGSASINCYAVLSALSKGFRGRLFVDYDVLIGNEWQEGRIEIPQGYLHTQLKSLDYVSYPQVTLRPSRNAAGINFTNEVYQATLASVANERFKGRKLIFKWAVFQIIQFEKNLYNYYMTTHSYRDAQSMRLDEPMYSNITGGYGLVGAYALDSLVHLLPENFSYNNN